MIDNNLDERPLNPNKEYLEQKELQYKQKKQSHQYLKKHQLNHQVLPCFRRNLNHAKIYKQASPPKKKSKAEVYEQIKRKNIQKFGQKKQHKQNKENINKKKTIDPLKMTINYKPKTAIFINTNEFKIKLQNQQDQNNQSKVKNTSQPAHRSYEQTAKEKYEKLLDIMRNQRLQLTKDKENFQKHKQKLEFKKMIQKQDSVPFITQIKKQIYQKRRLQTNQRALPKVQKLNRQTERKKQITTQKQKSNQISNDINCKKNLNQIQSKIYQLEQQKQEIQDQVYKKKRQIIDPDDVICTKYPLDLVNQIPAFDVQCFKDFIDLKTLHPHGNQFYQLALKVFETGLTLKQAKIKLNVQNIDTIKDNSDNILSTIDFKRKFQGSIRITKYNNGWTQVWNPGTQRLMANKELNYKVVWLKNGDIKQQWKDKKLESYYSKRMQVVQLKFNRNEPIYFFVQLNQLEQYSSQRKMKTVMFRQGRIEYFSTEEDVMNGFVV